MTTIQLVNHSTSARGPAALPILAQAVNTQLTRDVAPLWNRAPWVCTVAPIAGALQLVLFDNAAQAGDLGYHDETPQGLPYGRVFVNPVLEAGGKWLMGGSAGVSVASVVSHEAIEMFGDVDVNLWAMLPDGKRLVAYELCDPVENDGYDIVVQGVPVLVSDFVTAAWFNPNAPTGARLNYRSTLHNPFDSAPGGYQILDSGGKVAAVFADAAHQMGWRRETKAFPAARSWRRGVRPKPKRSRAKPAEEAS